MRQEVWGKAGWACQSDWPLQPENPFFDGQLSRDNLDEKD
jgi:hypothetical protein